MNLTETFIGTKVVSIDSVFSNAKAMKAQYAPPYQRNYVWNGEKPPIFWKAF